VNYTGRIEPGDEIPSRQCENFGFYSKSHRSSLKDAVVKGIVPSKIHTLKPSSLM
jgi:hypothetical protein